MSSLPLQVSSIIYMNLLLGISNPVRQRRNIYIPITKKRMLKINVTAENRNCTSESVSALGFSGAKITFLLANVKPTGKTHGEGPGTIVSFMPLGDLKPRFFLFTWLRLSSKDGASNECASPSSPPHPTALFFSTALVT